MSKSFFQNVASAPADPIFYLNDLFKKDTREKKVHLGMGVYRDASLKTPIFQVVQEVQKELSQTERGKEYLPIEGYDPFIHQAGILIFGENFWEKEKRRIAGCQTLGGTGALRVGGSFLQQEMGGKIFLPRPTWPNHQGIFTACGMDIASYPYYDPVLKKIDFSKFLQVVETAEKGSIVLLHGCCHNPTGFDLSLDEWKTLSLVFQKREIFPFFDFAYQGLGNSLEEDATPIRLFAEQGQEMAVAYTHSKNMGLYAERVGGLYIVTSSFDVAQRVRSKVKVLIRSNYSNPPKHGSWMAAAILSSPEKKKSWEKEVETMRSRICEMRELFCDHLQQGITNRDFTFLRSSKGMFCFTGLSEGEVKALQREFGIYMTSDGRINVAGLNQDNLPYVVNSIQACVNT